MKNLSTPTKREESRNSFNQKRRVKELSFDNQKGIENHREAAKHHQEAAKYHLDAAKYHEAGNYEKACESTVKAQGHNCLANDYAKKDLKYHALESLAVI